jgi:ABC-type nitrate/sulfonate/bicarbonate transport system permease component
LLSLLIGEVADAPPFAAGNDVHGYFASLTLCTFYGFVLLMSGWQAEQSYILDQYSTVLNRVIEKFPNGTLWQLNRSSSFSPSAG